MSTAFQASHPYDLTCLSATRLPGSKQPWVRCWPCSRGSAGLFLGPRTPARRWATMGRWWMRPSLSLSSQCSKASFQSTCGWRIYIYKWGTGVGFFSCSFSLSFYVCGCCFLFLSFYFWVYLFFKGGWSKNCAPIYIQIPLC